MSFSIIIGPAIERNSIPIVIVNLTICASFVTRPKTAICASFIIAVNCLLAYKATVFEAALSYIANITTFN